jgi:tetratricopeptide (TPR) repeat protein/tRNA A-37 threonylcarbamoyl transferase component Bud32
MHGSGSEPDPLGQLAEEFLARHRLGERPAPTEYAERCPELADQIRELFPALVIMEEVRPGPPPAAAPQDARAPQHLGEYRLVREIGRGGMGVVYEAEQESLGRRVALKVLPPRTLSDARHVERFQREARAAARLHHTNIVPVFAVGEEGGTHFYVMQYIEGRPLDEVIEELRRLRDEAGAPLASTDGPAPSSSGLLSDPQRPFAKSVAHLGVQVADALEYAAGQGVLHRDVKPSNLLLDVWGTVWLTDFGLAKASGTPDLTRTGDLFGTLRYLAPERCEGRADARSDVYALGLTLYELLALRPAFDKRDEAELSRDVTTAEPPRLDWLNARLPRDLVTVVHKAMARDSADRYQTAGALAEDLRRFLDDRSIVARRPRLYEQAWRWCRRNPTIAGLLTALLVLLLLATGGGVVLARQKAERRGRARQAVEAALGQVPGFQKQARWSEAEALLAQAASRLDDADSANLRQQLEQARADLTLGKRLEDIWLRWATHVSQGKVTHAPVAAEYSAAFQEAGWEMADEETVLAARVQESAIRDQLVAALDGWASFTHDPPLRARLLRIARLADPDPGWRDRFRDPDVWGDRRSLERLAGEATVTELSPQLLTTLGSLLGEKAGDEEGLLRAGQRCYPADPHINFSLGLVLIRNHKPGEAVGFLRSALAVRQESSPMHRALGTALTRTGQFQEVEIAQLRALELDPGNVAAQTDLGIVFHEQGRLEEAAVAYRRALELDPRNYWASYNLAKLLCQQGHLEEAIAASRRAIELDPTDAAAHNHLGLALQGQGRLEEATAAYHRALELDPKDAAAHCNLGNVLSRRGRPREAIDAYRRAIGVDPRYVQAHYNLGTALVGQDRPEEAIDAFRYAIELDPRFAPAHFNLGHVLQEQGRLGEAFTAYRRAGELNPRDADAQFNQGVILQAQRRTDEALAAYRRAIRVNPKHAPAHNNLGNILREKGQPGEAIAAYRRAIEIDPKLAPPRANLRETLLRSGRIDEARAEAKTWLALLPDRDAQHATALQQVRRCERLLALEARLPALLEGKDQPAGAAEQRELAALCQNCKQLYAAATRFYGGAFAAQPALADDLRTQDRYTAACAAALAAAGQGADAEKLSDGERARLRRQALEWLTDDLAAWAKLIKNVPAEGSRARQALRHWQTDSDLAPLRDADGLATLPPQERDACRTLWAQVEALLRQRHQD